MPKIRMITSSYLDLMGKIYPSLLEPTSASNTRVVINDLPRTPFFPSNSKIFEDHVTAWIELGADKHYLQGDMTSRVFSTLVFNKFIQFSPKFIKDDAKNKTNPRIEKSRGEPYSKRENIVLFELSYFDDDGVFCGVCIVCSKLDPTLWVASATRNVTASIEERKVIFFSPEDMMEEKGVLINSSKTVEKFLNFLKSKQLQEKIGDDVLLADGRMNISRLGKLADFQDTLKNGIEKKMEPLHTQLNLFEAKIRSNPENEKRLIQAYQNETLEYLKLLKENNKVPVEAGAKQSFINRHAKSLAIAGLAIAALLGIGLVLTGVLAPLGIALIGTAAFLFGTAAAGVAGAVVLGSGVKIALDERKLSEYQGELKKAVEDLQSKYQEECARILDDTQQPQSSLAHVSEALGVGNSGGPEQTVDPSTIQLDTTTPLAETSSSDEVVNTAPKSSGSRLS